MHSPAVFSLVFLASTSLAVSVNPRQSLYPNNCVPGQACWPTTAQWQAFNQSVNGRLQATVPYASPCFGLLAGGTTTSYNAAQCQYVAQHYADNPPFGLGTTEEPVGPAREALYGACHNLNWENCGASNCWLQSLQPNLPPTGRNCSLGRLSAVYVDSRAYTDVQKTMAFAQAHNIKMSIKNTGADYVGRSTSANSLALWTHNMNNMQYVQNFTAYNCAASNGQNVGIMGAGVVATDAYNFFQGYNMNVIGGAVGSIGLAGGFGQGGGHGAFGPSYGLLVDNAIEFDVVTADGVYRTINACNNPDLFFAMRGGGGSTYAVLVNYKFQLHPMQDMQVYAFRANFTLVQDLTSSVVLRDVLTALATNQTNFSNNRLAGYNFYYPSFFETVQILPKTGGADFFKNITKQYHDFLSNYPGLTILENEYYTFTEFTQFTNYTASYGYRDTPIGYGESLAGRLIPRTLFQNTTNVNTLVTAFLAGMATAFNPANLILPVAAQIYATGPANLANTGVTGVNTAWYGSLWEVVYAAGFTEGVPQAVSDEFTQQVHTAMDYLRALTPGGGCYMNEADYLEVDWQTAFFGSNYNKLLAIKQKYDPGNFFNCWKCVGWTGVSDPQYSCYAQSANPLVATLPF